MPSPPGVAIATAITGWLLGRSRLVPFSNALFHILRYKLLHGESSSVDGSMFGEEPSGPHPSRLLDGFYGHFEELFSCLMLVFVVISRLVPSCRELVNLTSWMSQPATGLPAWRLRSRYLDEASSSPPKFIFRPRFFTTQLNLPKEIFAK